VINSPLTPALSPLRGEGEATTLQDSICGVALSQNRTYENFVRRSGTPVSGVLQSGFKRSVKKDTDRRIKLPDCVNL